MTKRGVVITIILTTILTMLMYKVSDEVIDYYGMFHRVASCITYFYFIMMILSDIYYVIHKQSYHKNSLKFWISWLVEIILANLIFLRAISVYTILYCILFVLNTIALIRFAKRL